MLYFNNSQCRISKNDRGIKVQVRLTNEIDEELVYRGLLHPDQVHVLETEALVDVSSIRTVLPTEIAEKLGLDIRRYETQVSEVIIGLIALETLDFVVDYENKCLIPNPKHPDYRVFRI